MSKFGLGVPKKKKKTWHSDEENTEDVAAVNLWKNASSPTKICTLNIQYIEAISEKKKNGSGKERKKKTDISTSCRTIGIIITLTTIVITTVTIMMIAALIMIMIIILMQ